jgi:nicotinamide-nucleotide amidase
MFIPSTLESARRIVQSARSASLHVGTVETVTAGLVSAALTTASGASEVLERGFVLYGYDAKSGGLGIPAEIAKAHGAVSAELTRALAEAFFAHGKADVSVAVTGYAGPGGGSPGKPVGTIFVAAARRGGQTLEERHQLGGDRDAVRLAAVDAALRLVLRQVEGIAHAR